MLDFSSKIRNAGIVGAGGAGFPTHIKYNQKVEYIIANGAECEPLLYTDKNLILNFPQELLFGLSHAVEALQAKKGILAIKEKNQKIIEILKEEIKKFPNLEIFLLSDFYPAGDEAVLIFEVLGRIVPPSGIPLDAGVVVNNAGTFINICFALKGKALLERTLTINGEVAEPIVLSLPLGTSIKDALSFSGGVKISKFKVILGGPMMGSIEEDLEVGINKTTTGIIVLPEDHPLILRKSADLNKEFKKGKSACDQCRFCTDLCPRYLLGHSLEPHLVMRALAWENLRLNIIESTFLCTECNLCSYYACPLFLSPGKICVKFKSILIKERKKYPYKNKFSLSLPFRENRKIPLKRLIQRLDLSAYEKELNFKKIAPQIKKVRISLKQYNGVLAHPIVKSSEKVSKGQVIAEPADAFGVRIHASLNGKIKEIGEHIIIEA
ncbi:MAG: 4Fe-4S dicluster domain-containing protein [Armatimonadetes bacterium]|nr:4Fe-4S dicluster domain-containing protein [Armatimonadota bacterium]